MHVFTKKFIYLDQQKATRICHDFHWPETLRRETNFNLITDQNTAQKANTRMVCQVIMFGLVRLVRLATSNRVRLESSGSILLPTYD